jgi:hypothetical protein
MTTSFTQLNAGRGGRLRRGAPSLARWSGADRRWVLPDGNDARGALFIDLYFKTAASAGTATSSKNYGWQIAAGSANSIAYAWQLANGATGGVAYSWAIANAAATSTFSYEWALANSTTSARGYGWALANATQQSTGYAWALANASQGGHGYGWQIANTAATQRLYSWQIDAAEAAQTGDAGGGAAKQYQPGGQLIKQRLLREFRDAEERKKAAQALPKVDGAARKAAKAIASEAAANPTATMGTLREAVAKQLPTLRGLDAGLSREQIEKAQSAQMAWVTYYLRLEAYHVAQAAQEEDELLLLAGL